MTSRILSGLILILIIRGACGEMLGAVQQWLSPSGRECTAAFLCLLQRFGHDLRVDAGDLDVHLQGGDALGVPSTLKSISP
jgi:hypothetical protein